MTDANSDLLAHVRALSVEIGPRPRASAAGHVAAAYIRNVFIRAGLTVETQDFPCPAWEHAATRLEGAGGAPLEAAANAFSPGCDVTAPTVAAGTLAELETADLAGRIALLYGDLTQTSLAAKSWFLKEARDERIVAALETKRPAAVLTVQASAGLSRVIEDWEFNIPSATVNARAGLALLGAVGRPVHLHIDARRTPGHAANIVGRRAGARPEQIVICAHYDTKIDTPGAMDNAAGVAVMLRLAEQLGHQLGPCGLEFIAFTGEEYLPLGDDEYVRRCEGQFGQTLAALNFDGVGQMVGVNSITAMSGSPAFEAEITAIARRYPGIVWVDPWPQSNHSTFAWRGVPSIAFTTAGRAPLEHLPADAIEWISAARLGEAAAIGAEIIAALGEKPLAWGRA
jgi:aminopeptidase YwaD